MDEKNTEKKTLANYNTEALFTTNPIELTELLWNEYNFIIPFHEENISIQDMLLAKELIVRTGNAYSYLSYLTSVAKIKVRQTKRSKESTKEEIEDAIDRKEVIANITEAVKMQYSAISRLITVKQQINEELKMTDGK